MSDLAETLSLKGNKVNLAYFNEGGSRTLDTAVVSKLNEVRQSAPDIQCYVLDPNTSAKTYLKVESLGLSLFLVACGVFKAVADFLVSIHRSLIRFKVKYLWSDRLVGKVTKQTTKPASNLYRFLIENIYLIALYGRNFQLFRSELQNGQFDIAIIPEDVVGSVWPLFIKAAHEMDIAVLVLPYTLAGQAEAVQSLKGEALFQSRNNRIASKLFPKWRWQADGLDLVRLPSGHIFAHELFGVTPPAPWLMNSGYANAICVDSQASYEYFAKLGIPKSKLCVTGSVSQDHLFAQKAVKAQALAALTKSVGLVGDKPLLLISGCPNQLAGKVPYCEFTNIGELAQHVGRALEPLRDAYHVVVRPHPNYLEFGELMRPFGITSTMIPTSRLVPLSDLFIGFASATIRWAIACAVPTVNYDVFHYCYNDFGNADGVVTLTESSAFISTLAALKPTDEMYADLKTKIERNSKFWSCLDGGSADRIQSVIELECRKDAAIRTTS